MSAGAITPSTVNQDQTTTFRQAATPKASDVITNNVGKKTLEFCKRSDWDLRSLEVIELVLSVVGSDIEDIQKECPQNKRLTAMCERIKGCKTELLSQISKAPIHDDMPPLLPIETTKQELLAETHPAVDEQTVICDLNGETVATDKLVTPRHLVKQAISDIFSTINYAKLSPKEQKVVNESIHSKVIPGTHQELKLKCNSFEALCEEFHQIMKKNDETLRKIEMIVAQVREFASPKHTKEAVEKTRQDLLSDFQECVKERHEIQENIQNNISWITNTFVQLSREINFHQTRFQSKPTSQDDLTCKQAAIPSYITPVKVKKNIDSLYEVAEQMTRCKDKIAAGWKSLVGERGYLSSRKDGTWYKCTDGIREAGFFITQEVPKTEPTKYTLGGIGRPWACNDYIVKSIEFPDLDHQESWKLDKEQNTPPLYDPTKQESTSRPIVNSAPVNSTAPSNGAASSSSSS